jgi:DNA-binding MurR/RpiR family transcriptional regulator
VLALRNLNQTVSPGDIEQAIRLMDRARTLFVVGFRRSFPIASYLAYSLQQVVGIAFQREGPDRERSPKLSGGVRPDGKNIA